MKPRCLRLALVLCLVQSSFIAVAQTTPPSGTTVSPADQPASVVPQLMRFAGTLSDLDGKPLTGIVGVTFALYKDPQGGAPLWLETQNVRADSNGHYSVMLGSTTADGLPADVFSSGDARWLGMRSAGQPEQPRVMLLSVPYALKAGDAQTLGGLPASAFMLSVPGLSAQASIPAGSIGSGTLSPPNPPDVTTTGGVVNTLPLFTTATNIQSSIVTQAAAGAAGKIGINIAAPAATLDVNGSTNVRGTLTLPATGAAVAALGKNSQPQDFIASVFNSTTSTAVPQKFQWQAQPLANNTANASGTLNLLYASGVAAPAQTGLSINSKGVLTFSAGQTFPIPAAGVTDAMLAHPSLTVTAGTALTGGGTVPLGGATTLNVDATKVPLLASANTFTGNQAVNGNLAATGLISSTGFEIGSNLFAYGSYSGQNSFTGFAGNTTMTGSANTGVGMGALDATTGGLGNTGVGDGALDYVTTGSFNTGLGTGAGIPVDFSKITGTYGLFLGAYANLSTGSLNYATAIGANSEVSKSNAVVLGAISNVNGCVSPCTSANVGIGTTGPASTLDVEGSAAAASAPIVWLKNQAALQSGTIGNAVDIRFTPDSGGAIGTPNAYIRAQEDGSGKFGTSLQFAVVPDGGSGAAEAMRITPTALLGIGTTTPNAKLTVSGSETTSDGLGAGIKLSNTASGGMNYYFRVGATGTRTSAGSLSIANDDEYIMTVTAPGFVGIQTQNPSNILTILQGGGSALADGWATYSSRRWKTNIQPLTGALAKIEHLQGVSYDLKATGRHEIGVIAEEVGKVVPEVVTYEGNGKDARSVDYSRLTALLIEAVKQQQKEIGAQQKQIAAQERQIRREQRVVSAEQHQIARLNRKISVLEVNVRNEHTDKNSSVLESRPSVDSLKSPLSR